MGFATHQVFRCTGLRGKVERESSVDESSGANPSALEEQFCICPQEDCADLRHPSGGWKANRYVYGSPKGMVEGTLTVVGAGPYRFSDAPPADLDLIEIAERGPRATLCLKTTSLQTGFPTKRGSPAKLVCARWPQPDPAVMALNMRLIKPEGDSISTGWIVTRRLGKRTGVFGEPSHGGPEPALHPGSWPGPSVPGPEGGDDPIDLGIGGIVAELHQVRLALPMPAEPGQTKRQREE